MTMTATKLLIPLTCIAGLIVAGAAAAESAVKAPVTTPDPGRRTAVVAEPATTPPAPAETKKKSTKAKKSAKRPADMERATEDAKGEMLEGGAGAVMDPCKIQGNNLPECR